MSTYEEITRDMWLKVDLNREGVDITEEALEGVGTNYLENINFVFDFMRHGLKPGTLWPSEMILPSGTIDKVMYDTRSPYLVKKEDGQLVLEKNGKFVTTVRWAERPKFYEEKTSYGTEMRAITPFRGECGILACVSDFCSNWNDGNQCRYCNFNHARKNEDTSAVISATLYTPERAEEVGEVLKATLEEGYRTCFITSSGDMPGEGVCGSNLRIIEAVKKATGRKTMMGCVNLSVPDDFSEIDQLYEVGARNIVLNMEVWNPDMFKAICPGKAKRVGHQRWLDGLKYAVSVFGRANVFSGFVLGLEEKDNYYDAADWMSERGIMPIFQPWYPQKGSKLENHRPPRTEWIMEVHEKCYDIATKNFPEMLSRSFNQSDKVGCYRCQGTVICWDDLRRRVGNLDKVMPKDKAKEKAAV